MTSKPPIAGESDREYETRIQAERVTIAWSSAIPAPCVQEDLEELPLFGGKKQEVLFS